MPPKKERAGKKGQSDLVASDQVCILGISYLFLKVEYVKSNLDSPSRRSY